MAREAARRGRRGWILGVAALLLLFLALRFPYERLLPSLLRTASAATGAEITVGELGPGFGWGLVHVRAADVRLRWPASPELALDVVRVRPALSLGWLSGDPTLRVAAEGPSGRFDGALAADRIDGRWEDVDSDALPWALVGAPAPVHGRISGAVDLAGRDGTLAGTARLDAAEGSVDLPGLPVAIPYQSLVAEVEVGPGLISLSNTRLEGPLVTANVAGSATADGGPVAGWPIDLAVEIEQIDAAMRGYLGPLGIQVDRQGRAHLRVTGSLSAPYLTGAGTTSR